MSAPATYPSREGWTFTNESRSDFTFSVQMADFAIIDSNPGELSTIAMTVVVDGQTGENAGVVFANEDIVRADYGSRKMWRGHIKTRGDGAVGGEGEDLAWLLTGQDFTAKLEDDIIGRRVKRKRENVRRRVRWILDQLRPAVWTLDGRDLSGLASITTKVEPYDYFGMSVREALQHVADELRLHFHVDYDNVFHMFRTDAVNAPFGLSNVRDGEVGAPDYSTTFPFREWWYEDDSIALGNAILAQPELRKDSVWETDAASIAAYGRQERFISDPNWGGKRQAENNALRALAVMAQPEVEGSCVVYEPGLEAGHVVHIEEARWGHDFDRFIHTVETRMLEPEDDSGVAGVRQTIRFTDERRPVIRGRGSGSDDADSTNKNTRPRPGQTADPGPHPLTTFPVDVAQPTPSDGDTIVAGGLTYDGYAFWGMGHFASEPSDPGYTTASTPGIVGSYLGSWYRAHTQRTADSQCGGLDNQFTGFVEREQWWKLTVPAHPANAQGVKITVGLGTPGGYAGSSEALFEVVVLGERPTTRRQGTVVGELAGDGSTSTIVIPIGAVPAEGETMFVGYRPKWTAAYEDWTCGWTWPFMTTQGIESILEERPWSGHSGRANSTTTPNAAIWRVAGSASPTLGVLATPANAPFVGGNDVVDAGEEGAPTWSITDGSLRISSTAAAGKGIRVVGMREDETQEPGAWSDMAWGVEVVFEVDALGLEGQAGTRHLQLETIGQGERAVGTVHLGDSANAAGIAVAGPGATDYVAKALTVDEKYVARFDTRSQLYVRGKLWRKSDGEPAQWDVETALSEEEVDLDRWTLWGRVGNIVSAQELRVHRVRAYAAAASGQRIVKEFVGYADGLHNTFRTTHPFREDSLRAMVNGIHVAPSAQDGADSLYRLDFFPTGRSILRATYVVE